MGKLLSLALLLPLVACAPSPLYVGQRAAGPGTGGEVPRDGRGEPIWAAIKPPPATSPADVRPVTTVPLTQSAAVTPFTR
ncbi:hypothetical protein [Sandaracinobacteroides saxicola]|uniref:Uncharacterized protein n=1 Tax=Sandaracinobacteroides saxicola TaxID=2759707 RepID=A0A7G5IF07_9SPHN|nr:hypothetical protein [Sandaracinobacteroides saxicola]QMW21949.1 hypothetical protein H3309_11220 [Sandaracinobacteroides saxicola]